MSLPPSSDMFNLHNTVVPYLTYVDLYLARIAKASSDCELYHLCDLRDEVRMLLLVQLFIKNKFYDPK